MIFEVQLTFLSIKSSGLQSRGSIPLPHPTHWAVHGVGEKWIFSSSSRSFGYGYEAVRIRFKAKYT
jgi:hypothetical protein